MKTFFKFCVLVSIVCCAFFNKAYSQSNRVKYLSYIFPADSLKGFDETQASQNALAGGFFGIEYKVYMYRAKRNFINSKYGYTIPTYESFASTYKQGDQSILAAPCVNEDFEASPVGLVGTTLTGWNVSSGYNTNSCTMVGCCTTSGSNMAWVRATPYVCPAPLNNIPNSPFGGTKVLQMNDNVPWYDMVRVQQTFPVTATNALFQLAYMAALNGAAHACCDQPFLKITMLNCSNTQLACPSVSITPPGTACVGGVSAGWIINTTGVSYTPNWIITSIDLTPYLGTCVTIQITVSDCDGGAHEGWAFVDTKCSPMTVTVNNIPFPIGTSATNVSACGVTNATVTAPPGLGPYNWMGPGGSGVVNNPNQTFTTSVSGNYTLTMNPLGACAPITRTVNISFVPNPIPTFSQINSCTTYTFTNTGTGPPAVQTYSFVGAGAPPSFTTTATNTVISFPPSTTFTVYHTVVNSNSCTATASMVINVGAGPNPAFTTPTYTQCLTGNSFVFTATQAAGTHTFAFSPTAGAPATGFVSPYGPVNFTAPGTYTVTHTITSGGCTTSASSVVVLNPDPVITVTNNGPLCTGSNLILSATGGGTYSWTGPLGFTSAVQNPTINVITVGNGGVYSLTVTSLAGCKSTSTTAVTVTTPTGSANNTGPYCAGQTIQLTTAAASSYTWSGPSAFASALQNPTRPASTPAMSGVYTVTLNFGGCTATGTTNVLVNPLPVPVANNNSPICTGNTLNFTGGGGTSYSWSGPGFSSTLQNPTIPVATSANAGIYTLTVTDANSCTNTIITNVIINSTPTITVNNPTVCLNQPINFTATGGATYAWVGPGGFISGLQNPNIPSAAFANSGQYTVTVTSASGCTNTAVSTATVYPLPSPAIVSNTPCVGSTLSLNGSGGVLYQWNGPAGFNSNSQNPGINLVTMTANGTYTLLATAGTCTASITAIITINPLPNPNIVTNSPVCIGQTINLTGSGGVSYSWTGPGGFSDPNQNPTIPVSTLANSGNYVLTVTDANGCVNTTNKPVVVNPQPSVNASGGIACENSNTNLSAGGGVSYSWTGPGGFNSNNQNSGILVTPSAVGQYTVLVTDANTCTNTAVISLSMNPAPVPNIVTNSPLCIGSVLQVSAGGGISYSWTGPNGFFSTAQSSTIQANTTAVGGVYFVTATDAKGCTATTSINTVINPNPPINITSGPNRGCVPLCVSFTAATTPSATVDWIMGDGSYTNNNINSNSCYQTTGIFTITASVVDVNGCENTTTYTVQVYPHPVADFNYDPYKPIVYQNSDVHFTDASYGANITGWSWYFMDNASATSTLQNPTYVYEEAGQYVIALVVKSDYGCTDTTLKSIVVGEDFGIWVPNAFTVNGDGLNDLFYAKGYGIDKFEMNIFDRWGEKVFTSHDISEAWDGTYQKRGDKIVKDDTYTWIINVTNVFGKAKEFTGHVTLIK